MCMNLLWSGNWGQSHGALALLLVAEIGMSCAAAPHRPDPDQGKGARWRSLSSCCGVLSGSLKATRRLISYLIRGDLGLPSSIFDGLLEF
jgi:hypothetical protein